MIHSSINIPIHSGKYSSLQSKSKNTVYALKEDEENIRITQIARLKMAHSKLMNAIRQVTELENSIIPVSQNSIDIAEQSYRSGILNIDQLINSRKNYLDALLLKNRSIVDAGIQLAELNFLTGGRLKSPQLIPSHTPVSQLPYEN
ncbi:MAG: TolC family protein [Verrucomicrobia bacterium]|nr:TolC family protein [Verrucomicrobiota bacterium]